MQFARPKSPHSLSDLFPSDLQDENAVPCAMCTILNGQISKEMTNFAHLEEPVQRCVVSFLRHKSLT